MSTFGCRGEALGRWLWHRGPEGMEISVALSCNGESVSCIVLSEESAVCTRKEEFETQVGEPWHGPQPLCEGNISEKDSDNPLCPYLG